MCPYVHPSAARTSTNQNAKFRCDHLEFHKIRDVEPLISGLPDKNMHSNQSVWGCWNANVSSSSLPYGTLDSSQELSLIPEVCRRATIVI